MSTWRLCAFLARLGRRGGSSLSAEPQESAEEMLEAFQHLIELEVAGFLGSVGIP